jgi:hypothetical protein
MRPALLPAGWDRVQTRLVFPAATVQRMLNRARQFGLDVGGRFQTLNDRAVVLWSSTPTLPGREGAGPIAFFSVEWSTPDPLHATIHSICWDDAASSQEEIWFALDILRRGAEP